MKAQEIERFKEKLAVFLADLVTTMGRSERRRYTEMYILAELPVHKLARFFTEDFGRPTKEQYAALGSLILHQMHDLTDE